VFPYSNNEPTGQRQFLIGIAISRHIRLDLRAPPFAIVLRPGAVLWASVPETSVDKYCRSRRGKNDIHRPLATHEQTLMKPEPQPPRMQHRTDLPFPRIVPMSRVRHPLGRRGRDSINGHFHLAFLM
jgi:hypothetical protein